MDPVKMAFVSLAVLPIGLGSIHVTETLRWHEPRRGLWKVALAADTTFAGACALLLLYGGTPFSLAAYLQTILQMIFTAFFLAALAYLLHCIVWVLTRLGRRVYLDELFSRLLALAVFAVLDAGAYIALTLFYGGV
jgi:hypothetical protein